MRGLFIGIGVGIAAVVACIAALVTFYSGPELSLQASAPEAAHSGQPFKVRLQLSNPHDESVTLDSIDVDDSVFDTFEVLSVEPTPTSDSPISIFGQTSWSFYLDFDPGEQRTVEFELVTSDSGTFQLSFDVCNTYQDCSRNLLTVNVARSAE